MEKVKELIKYRNMIYMYTRAEVTKRYRGSALGIFWALLHPLFLLSVYGIVFSFIIKGRVENYFLFLSAGLLPWIYFRSSILDSANSIVTNAGLIKKVYFPREILPISVVLSSLVNFVFGLIVFLPILFVYTLSLNLSILFLPIIMIVQTTLILSFVFLLSSLTVYLRDLRQILDPLMMGFFYCTPIIYEVNLFPAKYHFLFRLNPMTPIIQAYQQVLYYNQLPNFIELSIIFFFSLLMILISMIVFNKLNKEFAERV